MFTNDRYVDPINGNDGNDGLTPATAWASFGQSTLAPNDCDIHFASGYFTSTQATVSGTQKYFTTDGGYVELEYGITNNQIVTITGTQIIFDGFTSFDTADSTIWWWLAGTNCELRNIDHFGLNSYAGIGFLGCSGCVASYCTSITNQGSHIWPGFNGAIVMSTGTSNCVIDHCVGIGNDAALHFGDNGSASTVNVTITSSIFAGTVNTIFVEAGQGATLAANYTGDFNNYSRHLGAAQVSAGGVNQTTIANWRAFVGAPDDLNSIDADPLWNDRPRLMLTLAAASPCLGTGAGGTDMGARGRGLIFRYDSAATPNGWDNQEANWTFPGANMGFVSGADRSVEVKIAPGGEALVSLTAVVPVGYTAKKVRWAATETSTAGATADRFDSTAYGAPNPNPLTVGYEQNGGAPSAYTDVERGKQFVGTAGANVHLRFFGRTDATVRT